MPKDVRWREIRELKPELIRCDRCGEQATTVHMIPWADNSCEQVLFACAIHAPVPEGYGFDLERWFSGSISREHLDGKIDHDKEGPGGLYLMLARLDALMRPILDEAQTA